MKKNKIWIIALIAVMALPALAQQGNYTRKSVSSLDAVWFKAGSLKSSFDMATFQKFMKFYVEVERFDYNVLPDSYTKEFVDAANALETVDAAGLSKVLEETVASKIVAILNDPEIMAARAKGLKTEADLQSFAATKARSVGLTADELAVLMNSAYLYLPFITESETGVDKKGNVTASLEGGIIWWQLKVAKDGTIAVKEVLSAKASGISSVNPSKKNALTGAPDEFRFGSESWATTAEQWAQNDAMLALTKNLGVKTKEIDDFKLSAQVVEITADKKAGFPLGLREGVHMDDGFTIVEFEENAEGDVVSVYKGYLRAGRAGKNLDDPTAYTYGTQLMGKRVGEGAVVVEHPRLGMDIRFNMGMVAGSLISTTHSLGILAEDATSQIGGNLLISYNLAPIIGVSQTFLDLDVGFGLPVVSYTEGTDYSVYVVSSYLGATKRFGGRMYLAATGGLGVDMLSFSDVNSDYTLSINALGVKVGAELGYMLNPDLSLTLAAGYKLGMSPLTASDNYFDYDLTEYTAWDDMNLGGLNVSLGASYALGQLPVNVFGFLDPFKRY